MIVYGFGKGEKPRAAIFVEPEIELARKAADLMGLSVYWRTRPNNCIVGQMDHDDHPASFLAVGWVIVIAIIAVGVALFLMNPNLF